MNLDLVWGRPKGPLTVRINGLRRRWPRQALSDAGQRRHGEARARTYPGLLPAAYRRARPRGCDRTGLTERPASGWPGEGAGGDARVPLAPGSSGRMARGESVAPEVNRPP